MNLGLNVSRKEGSEVNGWLLYRVWTGRRAEEEPLGQLENSKRVYTFIDGRLSSRDGSHRDGPARTSTVRQDETRVCPHFRRTGGSAHGEEASPERSRLGAQWAMRPPSESEQLSGEAVGPARALPL